MNSFTNSKRWIMVWIGGIVLTLGCGGTETSLAPGDQATEPVGTEQAATGQSVDTLLPPGGMELPDDLDPDAIVPTTPEPAFTEPALTEPALIKPSPVNPTSTDSEDITPFQLPENAALEKSDSPKVVSGNDDTHFASWKEIEVLARQPGRITVVDLWSLSCEPCMKEFPGLVQLHQAMPDKVRCISVNIDFDGRKKRPPAYYQPRVKAFLQSVEAGDMLSYICSSPSDDVFQAANIDSIPAVLLLDRQGELIRVFVDSGKTSGFTYEKDIAPLVRKLAT